MNTFLPFASYSESAWSLDRKRLGKQRVEALQLVQAIVLEKLGHKTRIAAHPAAKMWKGHLFQLVEYGKAMCDEWTLRGYEDTTKEKLTSFQPFEPDTGKPSWFGDDRYHAAWRGCLVFKDAFHYKGIGFKEEPRERMLWPTEQGLVGVTM